MSRAGNSDRAALCAALLVSLCASASCLIEVDYTGTSYACSDGVTCPDGFVCVEQRCVPDETTSIDAAVGPDSSVADASETPSDASEDTDAAVADASIPADAASPMIIDLEPTADTFININTEVNATSTTLNTHTWPAEQIANAILVQFDLSAIPAGATVIDAKLRMTLVEADTSPEPSYTVTLHKITGVHPDLDLATGYTYDGVNPWTPSDCCYEGIPLAQSDITGARDSVVVSKALVASYFDATTTVQEWLDWPVSNRGLLLNSDPSQPIDRFRYFASMEHPNNNARPELQVTIVP